MNRMTEGIIEKGKKLLGDVCIYGISFISIIAICNHFINWMLYV